MPIVFINSLGTDHRMWNAVVELLSDCRCITFDKRGHGLSATPSDPWTVQALADDVVALMDRLEIDRAVIVGCSVGGMIAQAMGITHSSRVTGLILSNTAAKIGTSESWQQRINAIRSGGIASVADAVLDRWFAPAYRASVEVLPWRTMLLKADADGYIGTCRAIDQADLRGYIGGISVPVILVAGSEDQSTPPALVQETADLIPSAIVELLEGSGHIPAIDAPNAVASIIRRVVEGVA